MISFHFSSNIQKMFSIGHSYSLYFIIFCQHIVTLSYFVLKLTPCFHAFTAISRDFLLSSGVNRLVTPGLWSENIIFPLESHMVTILIFGSSFIISE